jgi:hypothetical protein
MLLQQLEPELVGILHPQTTMAFGANTVGKQQLAAAEKMRLGSRSLGMVVGEAMGVIGKDLYYPAIGYPAATALDHSLQFALESLKPRNSAFDMLKLPLCELIGSGTGSAWIVG